MPTRINDKLVSWASDIDDQTVRQAEKAARLAIVEGHVALVIAAELDLTEDRLPDDLAPLLSRIERAIPAGVGRGHDRAAPAAGEWLAAHAPASELGVERTATAARQVGTLGSGNHFFEPCVDERSACGPCSTRAPRHRQPAGPGPHRQARRLARDLDVRLEDPDLAYFVEGTPEFAAYIGDMLWAQEYAPRQSRADDGPGHERGLRVRRRRPRDGAHQLQPTSPSARSTAGGSSDHPQGGDQGRHRRPRRRPRVDGDAQLHRAGQGRHRQLDVVLPRRRAPPLPQAAQEALHRGRPGRPDAGQGLAQRARWAACAHRLLDELEAAWRDRLDRFGAVLASPASWRGRGRTSPPAASRSGWPGPSSRWSCWPGPTCSPPASPWRCPSPFAEAAAVLLAGARVAQVHGLDHAPVRHVRGRRRDRRAGRGAGAPGRADPPLVERGPDPAVHREAPRGHLRSAPAVVPGRRRARPPPGVRGHPAPPAVGRRCSGGLVADPSPDLPLLDALVDDPSPYVRRSVPDHLNDISKDHPALALDLARRWVPRGAGAVWVVRHGLRTLVKRGDAGALELLGVTPAAAIRLVSLAVEPERVAVGGAVAVTASFELAADAVIDYRVHYAGARGVKAPKVFKWTRRRLEPGRVLAVPRRHSFEHVSIRRIHPGPPPSTSRSTDGSSAR